MPRDTDDAALAAQIAALRRLGPEGRFLLAVEMSEAMRTIAFEGERRRHPELTVGVARRILIERWWGPELAAWARRR